MITYNQSQVRVIETHAKVRVIPSLKESPNKSQVIQHKRVSAYCRVSTDLENQQSSYDLQVSHYTDYIQKNKLWKFSGIYADEGISGTSIAHRINFIRMIEDCKAGKIDMIITKSISRFARNTLDCLNYVRMLKSLPSPVSIYFEKENIDTLDAKSELLLTILSSLAQDESRSISENVRWSIQKRYQQGMAHCPTAFFLGYDTDKNKNLVINQEQAVTVRRIFSEFLAGDGTGKIAKTLTAAGIETGKGYTKWVGNSVYRILRNEKYCGDILMQKRVTLDYLTHKRAKNNGHQTQYFVENHHPAIISKEDWSAVQIELGRRKRMVEADKDGKQMRYSNRTVFSNILYCSNCGHPFMRRTFTSSKNGEKCLYPVWKCRVSEGRKKGIECHARSYREDSIEHAFMAMLLDIKHNLAEVNIKARKMFEGNMLYKWENDRMVSLQLEIKSLEERLHQASVAAVQSRTARDIYDNMGNQLSLQIEGLMIELKELNEKSNEVLFMERKLKWFIDELTDLEEFDPATERTEFREDIFKQIVQRGDVFDDGTIVYKLNIGLTCKSNNNDILLIKLGLNNKPEYKNRGPKHKKTWQFI